MFHLRKQSICVSTVLKKAKPVPQDIVVKLLEFRFLQPFLPPLFYTFKEIRLNNQLYHYELWVKDLGEDCILEHSCVKNSPQTGNQ